MYKDISQPDCAYKSRLWQNAVQDAETLCPFPLVVFLMWERAILKGPVGRTTLIKMLSQCFSVRTYITSLSSGHANCFLSVMYRLGLLSWKGDGRRPAPLEMDSGPLSFGHWQCRAVQRVPNFLCTPPLRKGTEISQRSQDKCSLS